MRQALIIIIWQLSAILLLASSPLKTMSGWMGQMHIFRFLQKYLIGFNPRLWLGHSRTFTELSISHSCCVFRFIVLLEGEPSAQFEVLNSLDMLFIKTIPIFWCIELFFYSDESLSPTEGKQPHSVRLLPAHCTFTLQVMSRAGFLQTWCLELRFSQSESPLVFCIFQVGFHVSSLRRDWVWPHRHKAQIGAVYIVSPIYILYMIMELN